MKIMCYLCWPGVFASMWLSSGAGGAAVDSSCTDVNCTVVTNPPKLPVHSEADFNDGYYCLCDHTESIASMERGPLNGAWGHRRQDFDRQECVCWGVPPEGPSDSGACLLQDCSRLRETPVKVVDPSAEECENGYYCYCASPQMPATRMQCPLNHFWQFWHRQRFDAAVQTCVPREEVACVSIISTTTPATTNSSSNPATATTVPVPATTVPVPATTVPVPATTVPATTTGPPQTQTSVCTTTAESRPHPDPTFPPGFAGQAGYSSFATQSHFAAVVVITLTLLHCWP